MAGRGPAPKDPSRRARRNSDPTALRVIVAEPTKQPDLPTIQVEADGGLVDFVWPAQTLDWWRMWGESPLSATFTDIDWCELMTTALLHAKVWSGGLGCAAELRLRVAKFGATPEDRARLRIQFAAADDAESGGRQPRASSRQRRAGIRPLTQDGQGATG